MIRQRIKTNPWTHSEEKLHYDSVIKFLIWALGVTGGLITLIVGIVLYSTYSNLGDLKKEYKDALIDFTNKTAGLNIEERQTIKSIKDDASQTVATAKADSKEAIATAKADLREEIQFTNAATQTELGRIRQETYRLALTETQTQVAQFFKTDKIQGIIQNQAVASIKENLTPLVQDYTKNYIKISDAGSKMRVGLPSGLRELKSYFVHPANQMDSTQARRLYDQISNDYNAIFIKVKKEYSNYKIGDWTSVVSPDYSGFKIIQNTYPSKQKDRDFLDSLIKIINNPNDDNNLNNVAATIFAISAISNKNFKAFEIDEVNAWYKELVGK